MMGDNDAIDMRHDCEHRSFERRAYARYNYFWIYTNSDRTHVCTRVGHVFGLVTLGWMNKLARASRIIGHICRVFDGLIWTRRNGCTTCCVMCVACVCVGVYHAYNTEVLNVDFIRNALACAHDAI